MIVDAANNSSTVYYAEGITLATRDTNLGTCSRPAFAQFPERYEMRTIRRANGNAAVQRVDANRPARDAAIQQCMGPRGYRLVEIPHCPLARGTQRVDVMPPPDRVCIHDGIHNFNMVIRR